MLWIAKDFSESTTGLLNIADLCLDSSMQSYALGSALDKRGQLDISLRQAATLVGAEGDLYFVVHVEPFRVVIHLFRH